MEPSQKLSQSIADYKNGKADAFNILYEESSKYVYTCVYKVMSGNDNVQDIINDIMQDTYVEISKSIEQLVDEERFLSWAGTIATRKCYAYLKKNKKYVLLNEEDNTFDTLADSEAIIPEEVMQDREKQRLVREIIDTQLTEMQKLCIIAFYYNEQKQSEIAEELGIPENTVKTNLSRAKAKIKEGVLDLEKNKGTKLYSVAPFLLLLFTEDTLAAEVPKDTSIKVLASVSKAHTIASKAGLLGKIAAASVKTKVIAVVIGTCMVGTVAGTAVAMSNNPAFLQEVQQAIFGDAGIINMIDHTEDVEGTEAVNDTELLESTENPLEEEYVYMPEWDIFAMEKEKRVIPSTFRLGAAADASEYIEYQCSRYGTTVHCRAAYLPYDVVNGEIFDADGVICRRYYRNLGAGVEEKYYFRIFPAGEVRSCDLKNMSEAAIAGMIEGVSNYSILQRVETENEYIVLIEYDAIIDNAPSKGCTMFVNDYAADKAFNIRIDQTAAFYDSALAQKILNSIEIIRDTSEISEYEESYTCASNGETMQFNIALDLDEMEDRTGESAYVRRTVEQLEGDNSHRFYFKIAPRGAIANSIDLDAKSNADLIAKLEKSTGNERVIRVKTEKYQLAYVWHDAMVDGQPMGGCELYINDYVNDKTYIVILYESMDFYSEESFRVIFNSLDIKGISK